MNRHRKETAMAEKKKDELTSPLLGVSENTAQKLAQYQAGYQQGENVTNAYNEYANIKQNAPQTYASPYQAQLDDLYNKIVNRQPFQYDMNGDMLYQNAKEQYQQLGKQAMVDTMGQAAQLTGGYGNSYAQNVGNQAYQQYLLKLNEQLPAYYNLAMQRYNMEGDALNNQYGLLNDRENEAYGRYRDTVSDYNQNLQMAYNVYNNERDNDYGQYRDALGYWQDQAGAENKDYWTQTQFEYQKEQDALDRAFAEKQLQQEMAYKYAALAQSRAQAAARQKAAEEEEQNKSIMDKLGDSFKSVGNALVGALGTGTKQEEQNTRSIWDMMQEGVNNISNAITGSVSNTPTLKRMELGNVSGNSKEVVDSIVKNAMNQNVSYQKQGRSNDDFKIDLAETLRYYYENNLIDLEEAQAVLNKFK